MYSDQLVSLRESFKSSFMQILNNCTELSFAYIIKIILELKYLFINVNDSEECVNEICVLIRQSLVNALYSKKWTEHMKVSLVILASEILDEYYFVSCLDQIETK